MKFSRGKVVQPITELGESTCTGSLIRFKADPEIFETVEYDYDVLYNRLREQAFLNAGLTITLEDKRPGSERREDAL